MAEPVAGDNRTLTEEPPSEDAVPAPDADPQPTIAWKTMRRIGKAVLTAAALALLIIGSALGISVMRSNEEKSARADAVAAARQEIVNLISINPKTLDADIQRLLEGATGTFKSDFEGQRALYADTVKTQRVRSTGEIAAAGMESFDGTKAVVLIAADSTIENADAPRGESRSYRFRVTVDHVDDQWLVSGVDFVP